MKKVLKITGIILLAIAAAGLIALKIAAGQPAAPKNYQQTTPTGGETEAKYMANGPFEVSAHEEGALQAFGKYLVFYPSALETGNEPYPVIVLCNGSGIPLSRYSAVAKHYASWGFIVIGTEESYSWNAFGAEMCLRYLERWNENEKIGDAVSLFYQKVDFDHVGIVGHSQGGIGAVNAITDTRHKDLYRAAAVLSPTNKELSHNLLWDYDASRIDIPIMLISGAGGGDDWVVTGEQLESIYDDISSDKLMMRRRNTIHNEVLYAADGYVTAWFMWHLKGDQEAANAFTGETAEILTNASIRIRKAVFPAISGALCRFERPDRCPK